MEFGELMILGRLDEYGVAAFVRYILCFRDLLGLRNGAVTMFGPGWEF